MCVICAGIGNERPTRDELVRSCKANPDGFGWGAVVNIDNVPTLLSGKSMDSIEAILDYESVFNEHGDNVQAHFFHARIATHGKSELRNCHPFEVSNSNHQTILAHNGVLPVTMSKSDWRSDSRVFAEDVLPRLGGVTALESQPVWDVLDGFVDGANSKVVFLTLELATPLVILGESLGHWQTEGLWWSNRSYEEYKPVTYGQPFVRLHEVDDSDDLPLLTKCVSCTEFLDWQTDLCTFCGTCQDCESSWEQCDCYVPVGKR